MVKISENDVLISRHELFVLIGAAGACEVRENQSKEHELQFMNFTAGIYQRISRHLWGDKKLPEKSIDFLLKAITPADVGEKKNVPEFHEDKQSICKILLYALQKTHAFENLTDLKYAPSDVTAIFASGNKRVINVEADSGIAMLRDILMHL